MTKLIEGKLPRRGGGVPDARAHTFAKYLVLHAGNPPAAYMAAFPETNIDNVHSYAHKLANRPKIKAIVRKILDRQLVDMPLTDRQITRGYEAAAMADIRQVLDKDGKLMPVEHWPEDFCKAVQSVQFSRETGKVIKITLAPKIPALDGLARMRNLFAADSLSRDTGNLLAGLPREVVLKLRERLAKLASIEVQRAIPQAPERESLTVDANITEESDGQTDV